MLPGTVDAGERLLMQQARHAILFRHATERNADKLLMIGRQVGGFEHRRNFVLRRGDFIVPGLDRNSELEHLALGFEHECQYALRNRAEVMIFEFLSLRRLRSEERAAGG